MTTESVRASSACANSATPAVTPPGWETLCLTDAESARLGSVLRGCGPVHGTDPVHLRKMAKLGWSVLSSRTVSRLEHFARGATPRPELLISNLPLEEDLPPTPTAGSWSAGPHEGFSDLLMTVFVLPLGVPISYRDQRAGRLFHNIFPVRSNANAVSSQSCSAHLGFHSEMFFHPEPPDFLMLRCLRQDPDREALTGIAAVDEIIGCLASDDVAALSEHAFAVDVASLHGSYSVAGRVIRESDRRPVLPVLTGAAAGDPARVRFEPSLTTPLTSRAAAALARAEAAAESVVRFSKLAAGDIVVFDNRRAVHSRSRFSARFDGTDRWLRRMMISAGSAAAGFRDQPDLELCGAWERRGALMDVVAYSDHHRQAVAP